MAKGRAQLNSGSKQETDLPKAKINKQSLKKVITLVKYLKPYRVKFFLGIFFLILTALTSLAFPRAMGNLIDAANLSKGLSNINTIAIVLLGILFFQAITTFLKVIWFVEVA